VLATGVLAFGLTSVGFLLLTLLLAIGWERRTQGARLIAACAATALWAAILAGCAWVQRWPDTTVIAAESLRYGAWIFLLAGVAGAPTMLRPWRTAAQAVLAGLIAVAVVMAVLHWLGAWPGPALRVPSLVGAILAFSLLLYVALAVPVARDDLHDGLAPLLVSLAAVAGYDLLIWAGTLFAASSTGLAWDARALVIVLSMPLIALAARRNPRWVPRLYVSRHVAFYIIALAAGAAGLILLVLLTRLFLGPSPRSGAMAGLWVVAGAVALLAGPLVLPSVRNRVRVFLAKHFYRSRYDYRAEWLRFIQTLSASQLEADPRSNAIRAIAQIIGSPGAVLYQRRDPGSSFVPVCTWPRDAADRSSLPAVPAADPMVEFLERRQWVIDLRELASNPGLYGGMSVPEPFRSAVRARMILPLLLGVDLIGFVVLDDPPLRFEPNYEDRDLLKTVGRHVATHIAQHDADRRLAESRQFEAFHRLTAYVMHDLKNLAAQLELIVANAQRHRQNPEFIDDVITTIANSTGRMQRLIEQLRGRELSTASRSLDLAAIVARACERCDLQRPRPRLTVLAPDLHVQADPDPLVTVFEHLVRNAQDATPEDGSVEVTVGADGGLCVVTVSDTGCGMTPAFIQERLFKPFDTTKGSRGMGIGAYQLREYVRSLGGSVEVTSTPGRGTTFVVKLARTRA
jgi:putative PEP-CTERM system histidine kinase